MNATPKSLPVAKLLIKMEIFFTKFEKVIKMVCEAEVELETVCMHAVICKGHFDP